MVQRCFNHIRLANILYAWWLNLLISIIGLRTLVNLFMIILDVSAILRVLHNAHYIWYIVPLVIYSTQKHDELPVLFYTLPLFVKFA